MDYSKQYMSSQSVLDRLSRVNDYLVSQNIRAKTVIVGGSSFLILNELYGLNSTSRKTHDIDIALFETENDLTLTQSKDLTTLFETYSIEDRASGVLLPEISEILDKKELLDLTNITTFSHLTVYTLTLEMFVVIKSLTERLVDLEDVEDILSKPDIASKLNIQKTIDYISDYKFDKTNVNSFNQHHDYVLEKLRGLLV